MNASMGGPVKAFYSTPSHYTDSVKQVTIAKNLKWEVRTDDVFPLANDDHACAFGGDPSHALKTVVENTVLHLPCRLERLLHIAAVFEAAGAICDQLPLRSSTNGGDFRRYSRPSQPAHHAPGTASWGVVDGLTGRHYWCCDSP